MKTSETPFKDPADFFVHFEEIKPVVTEFTLPEYHFGKIPKMYVTEDFGVIDNRKQYDYIKGQSFDIYRHGFPMFVSLYRKGILTTTKPPNRFWKFINKLF